MVFIGTIIVLMSWYNFSFTPMPIDDNNYDMIKYFNEALVNSEILNRFVNTCENDYNADTEWEVFIIDQIFIEKGINVIDYEVLYDSYENIGLKTMTYTDEWLINYSKTTNPEWIKIEKQIIKDITEAQELIDEENSWFNKN